MNIFERLRKFIFALEEEEKQRDVMNSQAWDAVYEYLESQGLWDLYVYEHMLSTNGNYFVFISNAKLFKLPYTINGSEFVFGELEEVDISFEKRELSSEMNVFRDADGKLKFISHASTSTINRVGEIDSTKMYERFEENFNDDVFLTFYHLGEALEFGRIRGVFRQDNVLFVFGDIDEESPIGRYAETGLSKDGWGVSIGFRAYEYEVERIGDFEIPVFTDGKLIEVSVLKEKHAASFFTNIIPVNEREQRMASKEKVLAALTEFVGDAGKAAEILEGVELRNRNIDEENIITREEEEVEESEVVVEATETEVELDEEMLEEIIQQSVDRIADRLDIESKIRSVVDEAIKPILDQIQRLAKVEEEIEEDKPVGRMRVTYRPTVTNRAEQENVEAIDLAALAAERMQNTKIK